MRNKSKIVDLFQSQYRSRVECPDCHKISVTFETYMYLSVPIGQHIRKTIIVDNTLTVVSQHGKEPVTPCP